MFGKQLGSITPGGPTKGNTTKGRGTNRGAATKGKAPNKGHDRLETVGYNRGEDVLGTETVDSLAVLRLCNFVQAEVGQQHRRAAKAGLSASTSWESQAHASSDRQDNHTDRQTDYNIPAPECCRLVLPSTSASPILSLATPAALMPPSGFWSGRASAWRELACRASAWDAAASEVKAAWRSFPCQDFFSSCTHTGIVCHALPQSAFFADTEARQTQEDFCNITWRCWQFAGSGKQRQVCGLVTCFLCQCCGFRLLSTSPSSFAVALYWTLINIGWTDDLLMHSCLSAIGRSSVWPAVSPTQLLWCYNM